MEHHYVYLRLEDGIVVYDRTFPSKKDADLYVRNTAKKKKGVSDAWSQTTPAGGAYY